MKWFIAIVIILVLVLSCAKHEMSVKDVVQLAKEQGMSDSLVVELDSCLHETPVDTAWLRQIMLKDQQERRKGAEDD